MSDILQIFSGNPLNTFIGKKIEIATSPESESIDWGMYVDICDCIDLNDDDGKDAIRAIKKRLQQIEQDRDFLVTNKTLTLLETCVSNCSHRFRVLAMQKEFIQELVKIIGPKNNPPVDLQERVLSMIQRWADAFRLQPELSGVVTVYNELQAKGLTFPPPDPLDGGGPLQEAERDSANSASRSRTTSSPGTGRSSSRGPAPQSSSVSGPSRRVAGNAPVILEGDGYAKISNDLNVVKTSIEMFQEILSVLSSASSDESDWTLAADLHKTCTQMKNRIVELIEQVANEDLTITLLRLNDDLNTIFSRYEEALKKRDQQRLTSGAQAAVNLSSQPAESSSTRGIPVPLQGSAMQLPATGGSRLDSTENKNPSTTNSQPARSQNEPSLIDFGESTEEIIDPYAPTTTKEAGNKSSTTTNSSILVSDLSKLTIRPAETIGSGGHTTESPRVVPQKSSLPEEISNFREQDFAEIENWLSSDAGRLATAEQGGSSLSQEPVSLVNEEFENFLANRAMAGTGTSGTDKKQQQSDKPKPEPAT